MVEGVDDLQQAKDEALARLRQSWQFGHLDATEHERRATAVRHATNPAEVERAERAGGAVAQASPIPLLDESSREVEARRPAEPERHGVFSLSSSVAGTIVGLTPFVALVLFFAAPATAFPSWLWFLLIPVVGLIVYGPDGQSRDRRSRDDDS